MWISGFGFNNVFFFFFILIYICVFWIVGYIDLLICIFDLEVVLIGLLEVCWDVFVIVVNWDYVGEFRGIWSSCLNVIYMCVVEIEVNWEVWEVKGGVEFLV